MKTLLRIAVSLERIANAFDRITGATAYLVPPADTGKCMFCHQRHPALWPCSSTLVRS